MTRAGTLIWAAAATVLAACQVQATNPPQPRPSARATPAAASSWSGRYVYEYSAGRNVAGTGMVITYTLSLSHGTCRLTAEGYQTDETIVCAAKSGPAGLDVAFRSYGDGRVVDARGNAVYQVGQKLFMLQRSGTRVLTDWRAYTLPDEAPHPKGVYFHR